MGNEGRDDLVEEREAQGILALKCLGCGAGTVIIAGPRGLSDALNDALDLLRRVKQDDVDSGMLTQAVWRDLAAFLERHGG